MLKHKRREQEEEELLEQERLEMLEQVVECQYPDSDVDVKGEQASGCDG